MGPVNRRLFVLALNKAQYNPIMLLDLRLPHQNPANALHFTNAQQEVVWRGLTYVPIQMTRGQLDEKVANGAGEVNSVQIMVENVGRQAARMLAAAEVEGAEAALWLTDRTLLRDNDPLLLTEGELRSPSLQDTEFSFEIVNVLGQQEGMTVPRRVYQAECNYCFGSPTHCGVDLRGNDTAGVAIQANLAVGAGSTSERIVLVGALNTNDVTMYENAILIMRTGRNGMQVRPVQKLTGTNVAIMRQGFMRHPAVGDECTLRRMCKKTRLDCAVLNQNGPHQHGGYPSVPPVRFKPTEKKTDPATITGTVP